MISAAELLEALNKGKPEFQKLVDAFLDSAGLTKESNYEGAYGIIMLLWEGYEKLKPAIKDARTLEKAVLAFFLQAVKFMMMMVEDFEELIHDIDELIKDAEKLPEEIAKGAEGIGSDITKSVSKSVEAPVNAAKDVGNNIWNFFKNLKL